MRLLAAILLILLCFGCVEPPSSRHPLWPPGPYATAAAVIAHAAPIIAAAYRQDGLDAVNAVQLTGDQERDRAALAAAQAEVDARWAPVAAAMRALRAAEQAYNAAIDRGAAPPVTEVEAALAALRVALPDRWRPVILPSVQICP